MKKHRLPPVRDHATCKRRFADPVNARSHEQSAIAKNRPITLSQRPLQSIDEII
jgi:hypothetical protein